MRARKGNLGGKILYILIAVVACLTVMILAIQAYYPPNKIQQDADNKVQQEQQTAQVTEDQKDQEQEEETKTPPPAVDIDLSKEMSNLVNEIPDEETTDYDEIIPPIDDEEWAKKYIENTTPIRDIYNINDHQPTFGETVYYKENETGYQYGKRMYPMVDIKIPEEGESMKNYTGKVDTSDTSIFQYAGNFRITGYSPYCAHCCGGSTSGLTASGNNAVCGYTISCTKNIPFGTTLYIEGYGFYVVEDRGVPYADLIDIACPTHDDCYPITGYDVPVYIVASHYEINSDIQ